MTDDDDDKKWKIHIHIRILGQYFHSGDHHVRCFHLLFTEINNKKNLPELVVR